MHRHWCWVSSSIRCGVPCWARYCGVATRLIAISGEKFQDSQSAKPEDSLAQHMANTWGITIRAFEKRSLYSKIYGTKDEITEARNYKGSDKSLIEQKYSIEQREQNASDAGDPIMPKGAWYPPIAGQTPEGLKNDLQTYLPQK